jgi:hypothetical protein
MVGRWRPQDWWWPRSTELSDVTQPISRTDTSYTRVTARPGHTVTQWVTGGRVSIAPDSRNSVLLTVGGTGVWEHLLVGLNGTATLCMSESRVSNAPLCESSWSPQVGALSSVAIWISSQLLVAPLLQKMCLYKCLTDKRPLSYLTATCGIWRYTAQNED